MLATICGDVRRHLRLLRDDGRVDVADGVAGGDHAARRLAQQVRESAPANIGSVSGKCLPMSPSAAAPSSASMMACSSTSASEWPSRPRRCGMVDAADDQLAALDQARGSHSRWPMRNGGGVWMQSHGVYPCSSAARYISAMRMSAGSVTFKFRGWPSTRRGDRPSISTALASSVMALASGAAAEGFAATACSGTFAASAPATCHRAGWWRRNAPRQPQQSRKRA
jgi:hypothetical protein